MRISVYKQFFEKPVDEIQALYDLCIAETDPSVLHWRFTITHVLVNKCNLHFKECISRVRRTLYNIGIKLHESDVYWIKRNARYHTEKEKERREKIRASVKSYQDSLPQEEWENQNKKRSETVTAWHDSENDPSSVYENRWGQLTDEELFNRNKQLMELEEKRQTDICENRRIKTTAYWDSLSVEEKLARGKLTSAFWHSLNQEEMANQCYKIASGTKRYTSIINDKEICFDSTWEHSLYLKLLEWNISFQYANELPCNVLDLGVKYWNPDFIVSGYDIVEVKGHPKAYDKFYNFDLPNFLVSEYAKKYNVYLCTFNVSKYNILDYKSLLDLCTLEHKVNV